MSNSPDAPTAPGNGRLTLLLIAGIPVIMILASSWLWYFVANGKLDIVGALGTSNSGMLVQPPRSVADAGWVNSAGERFEVHLETPLWVMVLPQAGGTCDALCENRLYEARQIHESLGKELGRVARMVVTPAQQLTLDVSTLSDDRPVPESFGAYVTREQRGMSVWHSDAATFDALFPELAEEPRTWYLMDPNGWIMMRYDPSVHYKDVISDLKFLIKNSNG